MAGARAGERELDGDSCLGRYCFAADVGTSTCGWEFMKSMAMRGSRTLPRSSCADVAVGGQNQLSGESEGVLGRKLVHRRQPAAERQFVHAVVQLS